MGSEYADIFHRSAGLCLDGQITILGKHPVAGGGYADVWQGTFKGRTVAMKVVRPFSGAGRRIDQNKLLKRLRREYMVWFGLSHPNVLEFLGFSFDPFPEPPNFPALISPWMSNGPVPSYLVNCPEADRLALLVSIAEGLSYLHNHEPAIVHGDLRAGNVLVSELGVPCLSDFGLSRILSETRGMTTSAELAGSLRWMSPELLGADGCISVHSDVWAFGMTILEVLTGERPYSSLKNDVLVLGQINDGHTPSRPESSGNVKRLTDKLWSVCQECWSREPMQRPSMREVVAYLCEGKTHDSHGSILNFLPYQGDSHLYRTSFLSTTVVGPSAHTTPTTHCLITPIVKNSSTGGSREKEPRRPGARDKDTNTTKSDDGGLHALAGLAGIQKFEPAVRALFTFYESLENITMCKEQCKQLHRRCIKVLLALRDNDTNPFRLAHQTAMNDLLNNIQHITEEIFTWSTLGMFKSIMQRSQIMQSLDQFNKDIEQCAARLNRVSQMSHLKLQSASSHVETYIVKKAEAAKGTWEDAEEESDYDRGVQAAQEDEALNGGLRQHMLAPDGGVHLYVPAPDEGDAVDSAMDQTGEEQTLNRVVNVKERNITGVAPEQGPSLAGVLGLETAVGALFKSYEYVENVKVYKNQCRHLHRRCVELLLTLHHNSETMYGSDFQMAIEEVDHNIQTLVKKFHTWSTWGKTKSLIRHSDIKQGLDILNKDLVQCATRLNMVAHMENLRNQGETQVKLERHHAEIEEQLHELLARTQNIKIILTQPERLEDDMRGIQQAIHEDRAEPETRHSLQERLLKIHRQTTLLPPMIDLTGEIRRLGDHPVNTSGGHSDIYLGEWLGEEKVALKLTRELKQTPRAQKRFLKEVAIWRQLQHKNVARLYGIATWGDHIYTVSPWMEHLDAISYITNKPGVNRLKILSEVATGLKFLHIHGVVHGDLRGANILISDAEVACITDFGLSMIIEEEGAKNPSSSSTGDNPGNSRWMAPELIKPELIGLTEVRSNPATDIWSYGMLCLEILTGRCPFHHRPRAYNVISDLIDGVRPTRPPAEVTLRGLSDSLWELMQKCWDQRPHLRPSMSEIARQMKTSQAEYSGSRSPSGTSSPHTPPITLSHSPSGSNINWSTNGQTLSSLRSSPVAIPSTPRNPFPTSESPHSTTPPASSSSSLFPNGASTGTSNGRPSTAGLTASSRRPFATSPHNTVGGFTPLPSPRAHPAPSSHSESASLNVVSTQGTPRIRTGRPTTADVAGGTAPRLSLIGETHPDSVSEGLGDILTYIRRDSSDLDVPTLRLERALTPDPGGPSSLSGLFEAPAEYGHFRPILEVALSEGSGNASLSGFSPTSGVSVSRKPLYMKSGPDGRVEAGTLPSLVERLIFDTKDFNQSQDLQFREIFLMSYQAFADADEVFSLLVERFEAVSSPSHSAEQRASVRYSVLEVLDRWLRLHHAKTTDVPRLERMRGFAHEVQHSSPPPKLSASAGRLIERIDRIVNDLISPSPPLTHSTSTSSVRSTVRPSEISPKALALALTVIEGDRYRKIIASDCIGWLKGIRESNGVSSFIDENNKLSYWVQKSILKSDGQAQRLENLKYFISVAEECRKLRNFSSTCALFAGLVSSSITNLKCIPKPSAKIFGEAEKLMSPDKNFRAYRDALNASQQPCVPWLRVHLHDVKVVHESKNTFINHGGHTEVINFELYHRVNERIRYMLAYQDNPHKPSPTTRHTEIQAFVEGQLRSFVVDDTLRDWLQKRAAKLAREELADFSARRWELAAIGFRPGTTVSSTGRNASPRTNDSPRPPHVRPPAYIPFKMVTPSEQEAFARGSKDCLDGRIMLQTAVTVGSYAAVWEGVFGHRSVSVKTINTFRTGGQIEGLRKRLWREYLKWSLVSHPNVFQCLGFSYDFSPNASELPSFISPWMTNGTIIEYVEKFPDIDRLELVSGVARGLSYLHGRQPPIIHGAVRAGNILISGSGIPCLSGFRLAPILDLEGVAVSSEVVGSLRWMSPELLRNDITVNLTSDAWAFGMTILEIMSGKHPYHELKSPGVVFSQIRKGELPLRPQDGRTSVTLTDDVWAICQRCWVEPERRPSMTDVTSALTAIRTNTSVS